MPILGFKPEVAGELEGAGLAFGELIVQTGLAVGETQRRLNETGAATTKVLANTLVDVIAVRESVYDDNGNLDGEASKTHTRQLPLLNFMDPVFYEWTNVRVQGQFYASEFATATFQEDETIVDNDGSTQGGILLFLGGGATTMDYQRTTDTTETDSSTDVSYGRMRMNALLRPRTDVTVPRPRQSMRGPNMAVLPGAIEDVMDGDKVTERKMRVLIEYSRQDGTPIAGKALAIEAEGVPWTYVGDTVTSAAGQVEIELLRTFVWSEAPEAPAPDLAPESYVLTARKGLVTNSTTVTF